MKRKMKKENNSPQVKESQERESLLSKPVDTPFKLSDKRIEAVDIITDTVKYCDAEVIEYFDGYDEVYYNEKFVKEFIKKIEDIMIRIKGRRRQLIELRKLAGDELI